MKNTNLDRPLFRKQFEKLFLTPPDILETQLGVGGVTALEKEVLRGFIQWELFELSFNERYEFLKWAIGDVDSTTVGETIKKERRRQSDLSL